MRSLPRWPLLLSFVFGSATVVAQGAIVYSQAHVSPALGGMSFWLAQTSLTGPNFSLNGSLASGSNLWPASPWGSPNLRTGSFGLQYGDPLFWNAALQYEVQDATPGDDHVVSLVFDARCFPLGWGGYADGDARVSGECIIEVQATSPIACGVVVNASIGQGTPTWTASLQADIGNDGVNEIDLAIVNGQAPPPTVTYARMDVGPIAQRVRVRGVIHTLGNHAGNGGFLRLDIRISPGLAASMTPIGTSCSAGTWTPALDATSGSLPQLGTTCALRVTNLPTTPPPFVVGLVGLDNTQFLGLPLPADLGWLGMPGCTQYLAPLPDFVYLLTSTGGSAVWNLPIPASHLFLGVEFFVQAFVEAPGANPAGLVTTNACRGIAGL